MTERQRVGIIGLGAVGARAARSLIGSLGTSSLVLVDRDERVADGIRRTLGDDLDVRVGEMLPADLEVSVLATPAGNHAAAAGAALRGGSHVVSVADSVDDVRALLDLDQLAQSLERSVVVGAGFAPGLSCLLAALASTRFERVKEIHVAKFGTGGPACARQRHRALRSEALDWREGWLTRSGGSGRELCWFPNPIDGHDCYRAALADPVLLQPEFAGVERITSRLAATRRDRLTMRLPMLRKPHPEGREGAIRVEVRGIRHGAHSVEVLGGVERPAVAAASVLTGVVRALIEGSGASSGSFGLARWSNTRELFDEVISHGVRLSSFDGRVDYTMSGWANVSR